MTQEPQRPKGPVVLVVTRGQHMDVAEWLPADDPRSIAQRRRSSALAAPDPSTSQAGLSPAVFAIVASVAVVVLTSVLLLSVSTSAPSRPLVATVADIQAVHSSVSVGRSDVRRTRRVAVEDVVETDADGRGRLRLDDGTAFVIDRSTKLRLTKTGIALEHGRVFVQGALGAHTEIDLGQATGIVSGADAAIERPRDRPTTAKLYSVNAEITVRAAGADQTVQAGFTASVSGDKVTIVPERGFDDWTGGMAAPWGARGVPRRAVGELWGRSAATAGDIGSPLTIRAHDVRAKVTREVAETEVRTTYFNAGSETVKGDFRMAIPSGAIVSRFASEQGESLFEGRIALARRDQSLPVTTAQVLEWAGEGWVRGTIPSIAPGATVSIIVGYVEWLSPSRKGDGNNWVVQYRYPMVSDAAPPLIGEFSAHVDAAPSSPLSMGSSLGARVSGYAVEVRRPDFRPSADLVVDIEIDPWSAPARLYTAPPQQGPEQDGATVLVRTETPDATREDGVTLALVVDTSASMESSLLDAERAVVEAVVGSLGTRDRVVVIAADQTARPVGPAAMGPVDAARRKAIADALASLEPGGATDLGRALEAGADALPPDAPAGMVIYIGDGWPTLGDPNVDAIQARLARRPGGAPRLGAVAVGPVVNRFALAGLVRGSGPLLEIADSSEAARIAIGLIAEALQPTVAGVEIVFGPEVERIYPRGARAVVAGDTVFATGRVRGAPPKEITLKWRDSKGSHEEKRLLVSQRAASEPDVSRRWAAARVEEIALKGKGREAATDVALRAGLLTPWTGWVIGGGEVYVPSLLQTRILDLASGPEGGFSAAFATPRASFGTLANVPHETDDAEGGDESEGAYKASVADAAARVIDDAAPSVRACRDSRAALRPELGGNLDIRLDVDGDGRAKDVRVGGAPGSDDDALNRCVEVVISGLMFPASGLTVTVKVSRTMALPPPRSTLRGRKCSATSQLPLPLRRGVWQERLIRAASNPHTVYLEAKQTCEIPLWTDRRALLELMLLAADDGLSRVNLARDLATAGEADAAALIRREAVRRAKSPEELRAIKVALVGDENYPAGLFRKQYKAAASDETRLAVVRRFLALAPHDARLRRRLLALLEAMGMKQELAEEVRRIRLDPFADAGLLADGASTLRRIGDEPEARRAFGELAERAPHDPWARAFLGDRLRNEGYYDDATLAYTVLEQLVPDDPAAILRLALAHAGANRLDIAQRMLARVAQTGGRAGDAKLGELSGRLAQSLIAAGRARDGVSKDDQARLARVALELPYPAGATLVLVRAPAGALPIEATLVRGPNGAREERPAEIAAAGIGLYSLRMDASDTQAVLRLKRPEELAPARSTSARVDTLLPDKEDGKPPRIVSTEIDLPFTGKPVELKWTGEAWVAG